MPAPVAPEAPEKTGKTENIPNIVGERGLRRGDATVVPMGGRGERCSGQTGGAPGGGARYTYSRDMVYECLDGYITVGAIQDKEWVALSNALGKPEWVEDPRFATRLARSTNRTERYDMTEAILKTMTVADALARCGDDVPAGIIHHPRSNVLEDVQVVHNQILFTTENPRAPFPLLQARAAAKFNGKILPLRYHAHVLGEDSLDIMQEVGISEEEALRLVADGVVVVKKAAVFDTASARKAPTGVTSG